MKGEVEAERDSKINRDTEGMKKRRGERERGRAAREREVKRRMGGAGWEDAG